MKSRSPLLGYNHNIRYRGRLFHVQTEDSGPTNPHLFTHLFFEGTILASKRSDYAASEPDTMVQRLMQVQHKSMLRELRDGVFDVKIGAFFGEPLAAGPVGQQPEALPEVPPEALPEVLSEVPPDGLAKLADAASTSGHERTDDAATMHASAYRAGMSFADAEVTELTSPRSQRAPGPAPTPMQLLAAELTLPSDLAPAWADPPMDTIPVLRWDPSDETVPILLMPQDFPEAAPEPAPVAEYDRPWHDPQPYSPLLVRSAFDLPPIASAAAAAAAQNPLRAPVTSRRGPGAPPPPAPFAAGGGAGRWSTAASPVGAGRGSAVPYPSATIESIFGEDTVSDKSLDEVILAYLAEDPPDR